MFALVGPLYSIQVFDRVLPTASMPTLRIVTVAAISAYVAGFFVDGVRNVILSRCASRIDLAYRVPLLRLRADEASRLHTHDIDAVRAFVAGPLAPSLFDIPSSITLFTASFWISSEFGWLILASAASLLAIGGLNYLSTRSARNAVRRLSAEEKSLSQVLQGESRAGIAMGVALQLAHRADDLHKRVLWHTRIVQRRSGWIESAGRALRMIVNLATIYLATTLVLHHVTQPGSIVAISMLTSRILSPLERVASSVAHLIDMGATVKRLRRFSAGLGAPAIGQSLESCRGDFAIENAVVSVEALAGRLVLIESLSVKLRRAEIAVVLGKTGSGKTLLCQLIAGIRSPTRGRVTLDGYDLRTLDQDFLHRNVGYLCENEGLGDGTIEDIIARRGTPKHDDLVQAAQLAGVHSTVLRLQNGYQTRIGEQSGLSAGELRKIALARAFYLTPTLIVLDEPTMHLDSEGEENLFKSLHILSDVHRSTLVIVSKSEKIIAMAHLKIFMRGANAPAMERPAPPAPDRLTIVANAAA